MPGHRPVLREARQRWTRHRGHEQDVEVGTAEHDARHLQHRRLDDAVDAAVRREADELPGIDRRAPDEALCIDGRTVRRPTDLLERGKPALVRRRAGRLVIVVGQDLFRPCVGEVEDRAVRAPARPVRADDAAFEHMHREIRIEAVERAVGSLLVHVHRAGDKPPLAIDLAIVEPCAGEMRLRVVDEGRFAGFEIEKMEACLQRQDGTARPAQRHGADLGRHIPGFHLGSGLRAAEDLVPETVDPVESLLVNIPERPFAQDVLAGHMDPDIRLSRHMPFLS